MNVPEAPFVLHLPNVMHLATDVAGVVPDTDSSTVLELAAALHPSAAVGGTPTDVAVDMIEEIEGMDRDRYAGPVGWVDGRGDGDWGIALRCGQLSADASSIRLFAGGGIVAASDPEAELAETEEAEITILREFLPEPLSGEELERLAREAVAATGASGPADMGKVMGALVPQTKGRADGKEVSDLVRRLLSEAPAG